MDRKETGRPLGESTGRIWEDRVPAEHLDVSAIRKRGWTPENQRDVDPQTSHVNVLLTDVATVLAVIIVLIGVLWLFDPDGNKWLLGMAAWSGILMNVVLATIGFGTNRKILAVVCSVIAVVGAGALLFLTTVFLA